MNTILVVIQIFKLSSGLVTSWGVSQHILSYFTLILMIIWPTEPALSLFKFRSTAVCFYVILYICNKNLGNHNKGVWYSTLKNNY